MREVLRRNGRIGTVTRWFKLRSKRRGQASSLQVALLLTVAVVAATMVGYGLLVRREAAITGAGRAESAVTALVAMLDQETGVRGYLNSGDETFLEPYRRGAEDYRRASAEVARAAQGDSKSQVLARAEDAAAAAWQSLAAERVEQRRTGRTSGIDVLQQAHTGKAQMDQFRDVNLRLRLRLDLRLDQAARQTRMITALAVALVLLAVGAYVRLHRRLRQNLADSQRELAYRLRQKEFGDLLQAADSPPKAGAVIENYLRHELPKATAVGVQVTPARQGEVTPAAGIPVTVEGGTVAPILAAGRVVGSISVSHPVGLSAAELRCMSDVLNQSGPALALLQAIAHAELQAFTDSLTGLPNRRAMNDSLRRMAAHASRTGQSLAAIAFDLDRFKSINDEFGHETGDRALVAVGRCLRHTLRDSDFPARIGGEEFLVLAPGTGVIGAVALAEKIRRALAAEEVTGLNRAVTASFGVAVIPDHALDADSLLRRADRAAYRAKDAGRDAVWLVASPIEGAGLPTG
jgi:diguanylate cyclase (GGDEF)-like protein